MYALTDPSKHFFAPFCFYKGPGFETRNTKFMGTKAVRKGKG